MTTDNAVAVTREFSGFSIESPDQALLFNVTFEGRVRVTVLAPPGASDRRSVMTYDLPNEFQADEIVLADQRLTCLARPAWVTPGSPKDYLHVGFVVELRAGMPEAVTAVLEDLARLAWYVDRVRLGTAALLAERGSVHIDQCNYVYGPAVEAVASIVLDGAAIAEAFQEAFAPYSKHDERRGSADPVVVFRAALEEVADGMEWGDR